MQTAANFILVADDDEPSREGLKLLLSRWGYAAETAVGQVSLPDVPTIIVTGTDEGIRSKVDAGQMAFGYLRKPVDVTCLKGLVKAAIATGSRTGGSA